MYANKIHTKKIDGAGAPDIMIHMAAHGDPGRPKKEGERRTNKLPLCLTESERKSLDVAAQSKGMDVSVWVRVVALHEAEKVNKSVDVAPVEPIQ